MHGWTGPTVDHVHTGRLQSRLNVRIGPSVCLYSRLGYEECLFPDVELMNYVQVPITKNAPNKIQWDTPGNKLWNVLFVSAVSRLLHEYNALIYLFTSAHIEFWVKDI